MTAFTYDPWKNIQGGNEIFYPHSHRIITRWKLIKITIPKTIIKHVEEMAACDKVTFLKLDKRAGFIYDNE